MHRRRFIIVRTEGVVGSQPSVLTMITLICSLHDDRGRFGRFLVANIISSHQVGNVVEKLYRAIFHSPAIFCKMKYSRLGLAPPTIFVPPSEAGCASIQSIRFHQNGVRRVQFDRLGRASDVVRITILRKDGDRRRFMGVESS